MKPIRTHGQNTMYVEWRGGAGRAALRCGQTRPGETRLARLGVFSEDHPQRAEARAVRAGETRLFGVYFTSPFLSLLFPPRSLPVL